MSYPIKESLIGYANNEKIVHTLVCVAMARPDYIEALYTVAAAFGLRRTFAAELKQVNGPIVIIERPEAKRLERGER